MIKKGIIGTAVVLSCMLIFGACSTAQNSSADPSEAKTEAASTTASSEKFDPYATENRYDISEDMFKKRSDVDYGKVLKDVSYYSSTAGDDKQCNILLPAGYDESKKYPVMYVFHGFGGSHNNQIDDDSYLTLLYGNMLNDGLAVPQITVNVDMYTDKQADKDSKSDEQLRYIYDKAIDDVAVDLMPFIEKNYNVLTGRENTAVAGMSEGGAKSLCTGFKWLDKFGYIGAFAPDTGVIPTEYYKGTFWNTPYMQEFPKPTEANTPYYLYMSVGSKDPWNIDCTLYYRDVLNKMGVKNQTDLVEGYEHDSNFWQQCFYNYLNKIFRSSPSKTAEQAATAVTAQTATAESKSADLTVKIGDTAVEVEWQDNEAVNALKELVKTSPLEIKMSMYGGFEQVGNLGKTLPNSDEKITTEAGDIVLYSGNQISVFYGSNTWDYTRLGKIKDKSETELKDLLGKGDTTLTISAD